MKAHFIKHQIEWKFTPPQSPWMGGFYERLIGIVKNCALKALYKRKVTEDELMSVLAEIEMRVNNRPITYMDGDLDKLSALTPSHLLYGRRLKPMPTELEDKQNDPDYIDVDSLNKRYEYLCKILKHWETVWSKEYLSSLRERFYGAREPCQERKLQVGDIVLVQTDGARIKWPMGKITNIHPHKDGNVRVVEVLSKGIRTLRTINKLVPLELHCDPNLTKSSAEDAQYRERATSKRNTAKKTEKKLKELRENNLL